nr:uncharacterized protein LOC123746586 isoform X1 [Procambarus clarkii]
MVGGSGTGGIEVLGHCHHALMPSHAQCGGSCLLVEKWVMSMQKAAYGTWKSPISSDVATSAVNKVVEAPQVDPSTGWVFWCEWLSSEGGQSSIFHFNPETKEIVRWTKDYDVRTKVHEYGGGAFTIYNNTLYFAHSDNGAIYRQVGPDGTPSRLTKIGSKRYADGIYCPKREALVYVSEDHGVVKRGEAKEPRNALTLVDAKTGDEAILVGEADFFAAPTLSPDGRFLAWIQWNHPQMPWWETQLCVAEFGDKNEVNIVFSRKNRSNMLPSFDQNNNLFYVHDQTGWWNLYKVTTLSQEVNLTPESKEVGWPMWQFGWRAYDINPRTEKEVVAIASHELLVIDLVSQERRVLDTGYSVHTRGVVYSNDGTQVYVVAGDGSRAPRLIQVHVASGKVEVVNEVPESPVHPGYISIPTHIRFPTTYDGFAYGYLYLPKNKDFSAPEGTKPPLLVRVHGGPTGAVTSVLNFAYQFFTSRGFALLDVNYRGSTGYGTSYRNELNGKWGILDVDDVLAGANYLMKENLVDPNKMCVDGGSAGGFTTLLVLMAHDSPFTAGASFYGVSDLEMLAMDTHKFESRYLDTLIGNLDTCKHLYDARSPMKNAEKLGRPVIFFQGSEDKIVIPSHSKDMYEIVKSKGLPTAYVLYQGEAHGFIKTENIKSSLEDELYFFSKVFNFTLSDVTSKVVIENLDSWKGTSSASQEHLSA